MAASSSALVSSTPRAFASTKSLFSSKPQSQSFPKSFLGLLRFPSAPRSISLSRPAKSFAVKASAELPLVGNVAPDFEAEAVFDQEFIKVKLSDYIGKKYVILFFYPLDFTFVCATEITAFGDRHAEFEQLNTEVLGVSVDSVFSHLAWVQTDRKSGGLGDLNYLLVSDVTKSISKSYGVLIPDQGIALRGLFIIDKEGVIQHSTVNNLAIRRSVDETKRTLQALQFVQDNPDEVCPAGWKPQSQSQTLTFPKSFLGLRLPSALHSISLSRPAKSFAVKASAELPLVGNVAPDFEADAVFDKEIVKEFINLIHTPNPKSQFSSSHHDSSSSFFKAETPHFPILSTKTKSTPTPQTPIKSLKPQSSPPHPYSDFHEKALYLDSIGLDLFSLVAHHPPIVSFPISDLKSTIHFLLASAGFSTLELRRLVGMCPEILASKVSDILPVFTFLLREARVNGSDLKRVINRRPRLLVSSVKHRLRPTLYFLQSIGITHVSKHTALLSCSVEDKLQPRVDYLEKIGFSRADALAMFRRFPQLFCYSIEHNLEPKFNYFVVQMGRELKELKEFPHYFSFSLDNRIRPRHQRCIDRGVFLPLPILLKTSETKFRERLEGCCNSSIPLTRSPLWCTKMISNDDDLEK